ncbi:MAG TPA: hypothetical protein VMZ53_07395 [Kofleriaceae bacterium]|nr:hypothetical protein [Kofleriaceae bacterium]
MIRAALALLVLAGSANASPVTKCKPGKGTPIFEARWRSGGARVVTKLYASGMWTRLATSPPQRSEASSGCIEPPTIDEIKAALKTVKWKKPKPQEKCYGVDVTPTDFFAGGQKRYTRQSCGGYELDEASAKLIDVIEHQIPMRFENPALPDYEEI